MTTSQPLYQDLCPELDSASDDQPINDSPAEDQSAVQAPVPGAGGWPLDWPEHPPGQRPPVPPPPPRNWPPQYGQLAPPQLGHALLIPPPQFGRLPQATRMAQIIQPARSHTHLGGPGPQPQSSLADRAAPVQQHGVGAEAIPPLGSPDVHTPPPAGQLPGPPVGFGARAISFLIDFVAPIIVLSLLLSIAVTTGSTALSLVIAVVGFLALLGFGISNSSYLQGVTGQSLGKRVARTKLVDAATGQPVGFSRATARQIGHELEFGAGYLRPLWDGRRQTVADKIARTVVVRVGAATEDRSGNGRP